ncbi:unnamed protein product [Gordionus sp. m RMFG-2023]
MRNPILSNKAELKKILINLNLMKQSDTSNIDDMQKMYLTYYYDDFYDFDYEFEYDTGYPYDTLAEVSGPNIYAMEFERAGTAKSPNTEYREEEIYTYDLNKYDYDPYYENKYA